LAPVTCPAGVYHVNVATAARIQAGGSTPGAWTIDGGIDNSRERFFRALAAELKFPAYFGHNWDAAYDCLTDLASADELPAVLLITSGDQFVTNMGSDWQTGQRVFTDAAAMLQGGGRLLLVLLVSDAALPGVPTLPPECLEQVAPVDADQVITQVDGHIRTLNRSGNFEFALQQAHELVSRFPDNPRAHFVLAGTFDFQDRETEALPPYQRAWELGLVGDDLPRFYVQYGSTLRNVGQFDEAVRVLQEGRERFPENAAIQAFLALALFSAGRAAEAVAAALSVVLVSAGTGDLHGYERALREYVAALLPPDEAQEFPGTERIPKPLT
jgi:tetratricopeptide (TPR) repeat protein